MPGIPVVIVTSGGLGVTVVPNGLSMTVGTTGIAVRQTTNGLPVSGITFGPDVTAPIITSANTVSWPENSVLNHILAANETVTWAKVGGADTAKFTLVGNVLTLPAKDYEVPDDADANRTYIVQVQATDAASNPSTIQTITVTITDVSDAVGTFSLIQTDYGSESSSSAIVTYAGKSLGAADPNRYIVVSCFNRQSISTPVAIAVSVDGVAATLVKRTNQFGEGTEIWIADLTANSNTTGDVVLNYTGTGTSRTAVKVHRLITGNPVATDTQDAVSASGNSLTTVGALTIPSGGGAVAIYGAHSPSSANNITFTGVTLDTGTAIQIAGFSTAGTGISTTAGAVSITASIAGATNSLVSLSAATWGPATGSIPSLDFSDPANSMYIPGIL